jgi:glycerol-3-phosphate dehydrogenase/1-acyl-sn-glycerol-3-phosphate acyltransferase
MTEKEATVGRWYKEFFENIHLFIKSGLSEADAQKLLEKFLQLSGSTPKPRVMEIFTNPALMEEIGVHTVMKPEAREFMVQFLDPIMKKFKIEGIENLEVLNDLYGKYPITLISNHLSHLDAPAIFALLYGAGSHAKNFAERMLFIAGRLAFEPDFTRLGLYMFDTLLVCSKKDMSDNPSMSDVMTKINMRAFRQSQKLQNDGKVVCIFPEGTRSRDGRLMPFVDTVYHYVANKVVVPISLEGTDKILPTSGFLFNQSNGKLVVGKPVLVGELSKKQMETFPKNIDHIEFPNTGDKKQFLIDNLALLVGSNLNKHQHGTYRNLYNADVLSGNVLIQKPKAIKEKIVVLGSSTTSIALATLLTNKDVEVHVYNPNEDQAKQSEEERRDVQFYPIYKLPPNMHFTSDPKICEEATIFIQGANPWMMDSVYPKIKDGIISNPAPIVNVIKGFTGSTKGIILDDMKDLFGIDEKRFAAVGGAYYPDQIMERKISGFEVAAIDQNLIPRIIGLLNTGYISARPAINPEDIRGVQLGGALKTIYAISMGIVEGYYRKNLGGNVDNTLFHLSSRFFGEMVKVGKILGGKETTFQGLSGLTDLMLACFGSDTKDRKYGFDIANNIQPEKITNGYYGLKVLPNLVNFHIDEFPIVSSAFQIVIEKKPLDEIASILQTKLSKV